LHIIHHILEEILTFKVYIEENYLVAAQYLFGHESHDIFNI